MEFLQRVNFPCIPNFDKVYEMSRSSPGMRRADARRSVESIVGAAVQVLDADPDASMGAVAAAAGVTRQTVYAHFPSRGKLLSAVLDHLTDEAVAEIDAVGIDEGPAMEALFRLVEASDRVARRYPGLFHALGTASMAQGTDDERHAPVADRLERTVRRGQAAGELDAQVPPRWAVAATIKLGHAAAEEVGAGRLSEQEADAALRTSLGRILAPARTRATTG